MPFPHRNRHISYHPLRLNAEEDAILDVYPDRQPAIQTGCVNPNGLSRKKPADRQRLKGSLSEPLLLAIDRQPIVRGKIVEGGKGNDGISSWE